MATEDIEFTKKERRIFTMLGTTELPRLLAASLEAGHTHYISPTFAVITRPRITDSRFFEAAYPHEDQHLILRNLLIDILWEVYKEGQ